MYLTPIIATTSIIYYQKNKFYFDGAYCESESSQNQIYRIVLTGGPCAGKSTALSHISNRLMSLGFHVFIVPEAATLLITGGGLYSFNMNDVIKKIY